MKRFISLIFGLVAVLEVTSHAQLTLNPGETFEYSFSSLPQTGGVLGPLYDNKGGVLLTLDESTVGADDLVQFELFEEGIEGSAFAINTTDLSTGGRGFLADGLWEDRNGSLRITAVSGAFTINQVTMQRGEPPVNPGPLANSQLYSLTITPVPEPATIALGFLGAAALLFWKRK